MKVAEVFAEFRARTDKLRADLRKGTESVNRSAATMSRRFDRLQTKAQRTFRAIGRAARESAKAIAVIGAATTGVILVLDRASQRINRLSARARGVGADPRTLQGLQEVFRSLGEDVEGAQEALAELNLRAAEAAAEPIGDIANAFRELGLNVEAFLKLNPEERLQRFFAATQRFGQTNGLAALGFVADRTLGGTEGRQLLPALAQGPSALAAGGRAAGARGLIDGGLTRAAQDAQANLDRMKAALERTTNQLLRLAPAIEVLADSIDSIANPGRGARRAVGAIKTSTNFAANAALGTLDSFANRIGMGGGLGGAIRGRLMAATGRLASEGAIAVAQNTGPPRTSGAPFQGAVPTGPAPARVATPEELQAIKDLGIVAQTLVGRGRGLFGFGRNQASILKDAFAETFRGAFSGGGGGGIAQAFQNVMTPGSFGQSIQTAAGTIRVGEEVQLLRRIAIATEATAEGPGALS